MRKLIKSPQWQQQILKCHNFWSSGVGREEIPWEIAIYSFKSIQVRNNLVPPKQSGYKEADHHYGDTKPVVAVSHAPNMAHMQA